MRQFVKQSFVIFILFCSCRQKKENVKTEFLNIPPFYLRASIDSTGHCDSATCYYVTVTLENKTLLNLQYYSWTCSWTENFVTNSRNFEVIQNICFMNWYFTDTIPPLGKKIFPLIIRNVNKQQNDLLKIGFTFVDPNLVPADKFLSLTQSERLKNINWSNSISTLR